MIAVDRSRDGTLLVSASSDRTARLWNPDTRAEIATLEGHTDLVTSVAVSPDGHRIATASKDGSVRVWTRNGDCLLVAAHHGVGVNAVAWFPDGRRLAAASDDHTVSIFDSRTGRIRRVLEGHSDAVEHVAVYPDGVLLASASRDGSVGIWNAATGARLALLPLGFVDARTGVVARDSVAA